MWVSIGHYTFHEVMTQAFHIQIPSKSGWLQWLTISKHCCCHSNRTWFKITFVPMDKKIAILLVSPLHHCMSPWSKEGVFFFWTHFWLGCWMATHLRMRSATPSVYFDLEKGVLTMIDCQKDCGCKSYSSGDFKKKELQPITTMCLQWNVNRTGKYLATVQFLLSPLKIFSKKIMIMPHIVYSS